MYSSKKPLNAESVKEVKELYETRFAESGYSPQTLGWIKGKQSMRFHILMENFNCIDAKILDVGCGFGDLNKYLLRYYKSYTYHGIDLTDSFIGYAEKSYSDKPYITFEKKEYLSADYLGYDYIIGSGIFNLKFSCYDNVEYVERVIEKAFKECRRGCAFDFLSNKVDYKKYEHTFHHDPLDIIMLGYKLTRNLVFINNYAPFEFSLVLFKDESFDPQVTVFNEFMASNNWARISELKI